MDIRMDDLSGGEIAALLSEHLEDMHRVSPPESVHALDLDELRKPEMTFWTIWEAEQLAGCGAIKELDPSHGEIKSMRTATAFRRRGMAAGMLQHIIAEAGRRRYRRLSLETGSMAYFAPARQLYAQFGFTICAPFTGYEQDPNSVFMSLEIMNVNPQL